ncbi:hypothetical protein M405DRAFT_861285 [Rhizopogon salebrosus TDB-379]|nr:hypothetical protein M405DRAFT_861285 [Rhizopogon salebrosus TDB-379]
MDTADTTRGYQVLRTCLLKHPSLHQGSPMDEDESHGSSNDDVDEDMNSAGRDSDDVEGDVDEEATGRGDNGGGKEHELKYLDDQDEAGSQMEDERSEFNYGAEDREGTADNEDDYGEY